MNNKEKYYIVKAAGFTDWFRQQSMKNMAPHAKHFKNVSNTLSQNRKKFTDHVQNVAGVNLKDRTMTRGGNLHNFAQTPFGQQVNQMGTNMAGHFAEPGKRWGQLKDNVSGVVNDYKQVGSDALDAHNNANYQGAYNKRELGRNVADIKGKFTGESNFNRIGRNVVGGIDKGVTGAMTGLQNITKPTATTK